MLIHRLLHEARYFFGLGRHWAEGLPNHEPDLDDTDIKQAVENGKISIEEHQKRITEGSSRP